MKSSIQKGTENKFYVISLMVATILFVVFFTSKLWMYDDAPIMQTPFNAEITGLDQTTLKLFQVQVYYLQTVLNLNSV